MNIDPTKAYVTLPDGSVFQALREDGEFDEVATDELVQAHLNRTE